MPLDPTLEPKQSPDQQPLDKLSTIDVTGAYHPEADTTVPHEAAVEVLADALQISGYVITGELARGGMGRVLAGRELTLDRDVAIKVLLPGADAGRFITESKITARLPHPSIPPVYALGSLADGSPFLAMKLVQGKTLADELKARPNPLHNLSRFLQIFEQIAQAVGFAHSQGIIHRDLKPANIMVGAFGEVQVMDWGLAKAFSKVSKPVTVHSDSSHTDSHPLQTLTVAWKTETHDQLGDQTRSGAILGTPNYMAPEQARGEPATVRSDVFALGGILCAILTGKAVFGGTTVLETVKQAAAGDITETVQRLDSCGADTAVIALAKQCLEVIPTNRPPNGQDVATLVATYRQNVNDRLKLAETAKAEALVREAELRKRRKVWLGLTVTLLVGLIASGTLAWFASEVRQDAEQARLLEKERADGEANAKKGEQKAKLVAESKRIEAEKNLAFAKKGNEILGSVFAGLDPKKNYASLAEFRNTLKNKLNRAIKELEGTAIGDPLEVASMQNILGQSLLGLGSTNAANEVLLKAVETRKANLGPNHIETLQSTNNLATGYQAAGKVDQAILLLEETLAQFTAQLGSEHPDTLLCMNNLAAGYQAAGKLDKALPLLEKALTLMKKKNEPNHTDLLISMNNLAMGYRDAIMLDKALPLLEEASKLQEDNLGRDHPETLTSMDNLATIYQAVGKMERAIPLHEETLKLMKATLGPEHPSTLVCMINMADDYRAVRKYDLAQGLLEEALAKQKHQFGKDHATTLICMSKLARTYQDTGKHDKAIPLFRESLELRRSSLGANHPVTLVSMNNLAMSYHANGQKEKALLLLEETLKLRRKTLGPDNRETLLSMHNLAGVYFDAGQVEKALPLFEEAYTRMSTSLGQEHLSTIRCMGNLGRAYAKVNQGEKAAATYTGFLASCRITMGSDSTKYAAILSQVADDLMSCKQYVLAEKLLVDCLAIREKTIHADWSAFDTRSLLGEVLLCQKKYAEAEPLLLKGYEGMKAHEKSIPPQSSSRIPKALDRLIQLYTETNKSEEVKKWQAERAKLTTK